MRVNSLITHLQLKKMLVMYESAHVVIAFQLLEMSSITTLNKTIFECLHKVLFQRVFRKNVGDITDLHNEKINLEVLCKRNCLDSALIKCHSCKCSENNYRRAN